MRVQETIWKSWIMIMILLLRWAKDAAVSPMYGWTIKDLLCHSTNLEYHDSGMKAFSVSRAVDHTLTPRCRTQQYALLDTQHTVIFPPLAQLYGYHHAELYSKPNSFVRRIRYKLGNRHWASESLPVFLR
ncbi:hypothetical protein QBC37DRAFT_80652 [Rhypophila decipiens]|uniref:Beta-lactamase-related domain-containing protein n=1 Tax=Rhypophila decipiens TaxID=261697 RepID=A0AAN7BAP2_9PEZI|nr:hypothetical protein QBC37DRAFT_80652 [Rhypophila decipiens]